LDVGSGSGYLTACFAKAVAPNGKAIGIETIPSLVELSIKNVQQSNPELFEAGVIDLLLGDGQAGFEAEAPYDAIHVGAAAAHVPQKV
jgi:protein-L-isoaspartate(D-aspartate) O-methyltransferase